ncbi:MAG: hypothetical protein US98_C0035G0005 [Parcubacteria group bacterium GW2011_GWC1_38_6]|nr:MAG: hypothetical protein US98_C0035G0005 [Parcubacteria group bacterium GW2011_GWC1_38_6]
MDGLLRCSYYAFGPNRLHYCGPDANQEIAAYMKEGIMDPGLESLLKAFRTMYPYLLHIARANKIDNPFDEKVVEAYWIGNELLDAVDKKEFYRHLIDDQKINKKLNLKSFGILKNKMRQGAVPHHSFHVLNIWRRTGHLDQEHTLESMDQCRISWGKIVSVDGPFVVVKYQPLVLSGGKLSLGEITSKKITRNLNASLEIDELKVDDEITLHWGVICEKINGKQVAELKKYTNLSLYFANQTI